MEMLSKRKQLLYKYIGFVMVSGYFVPYLNLRFTDESIFNYVVCFIFFDSLSITSVSGRISES
ncbi:MAG: hypothetical protein AXW17_12810 [Colwellia sp. Phe_37]|nr:MAG: hypothetical protein AXW17_12810 [Colwellia sp. Phe_37]